MTNDTKQKLIDTVINLLNEGEEVKNLTARRISLAAGTNLAMINYCFKSKDELIKEAVLRIVRDEFDQHAKINLPGNSPKEQLKDILVNVSKVMIKFNNLTKASIPYFLLKDQIILPYEILPFINNHYETRKSDTECKVIAYQIVSFFQLVFYKDEEFYRYSGIDLNDENQMEKFIKEQIDFFLS